MELKPQIIKIIRDKGYITISDFMGMALSTYKDSYYRKKNPFGSQGDFITSPEISQMFGEMIGIWIYNQWVLLGKPSNLNLVELGPGQGVLMRDALKVILKSEMAGCFSVFMLDINEELILRQKENLHFFDRVKWIKNISDVPNSISIFVANEFFDALPISQYIKEKLEWKEVILRTAEHKKEIIFDKLSLHNIQNDHFKYEHKNANDGAIIEESIAATIFIKELSNHSEKYGSISLIIDYGYDVVSKSRKPEQYHPTLQAIKQHQYTPLLTHIGDADLSAHVDFNHLKKTASASGASSFGTMSQHDFLQKLGIEIRLQKLKEANPELKQILDSQYDRLMSRSQMGELFKAMCITKKGVQPFLFD